MKLVYTLLAIAIIPVVFTGCKQSYLKFDTEALFEKFGYSSEEDKDEKKEHKKNGKNTSSESKGIKIVKFEVIENSSDIEKSKGKTNNKYTKKTISKKINEIEEGNINALKKLVKIKDLDVKLYEIENDLVMLIDTSKHIFFKSGDFKISSKSSIDKILKVLKNRKIMLIGHTDSVGEDRYNQLLSEMRAKEIYKTLIRNGINKDQVDYIGYGEEQPIATNKTKKGRSYNRRVEIAISGKVKSSDIFLNNRDIKLDYLNNHRKIGAGKVKVSQKGLTKDKKIENLKDFYANLNKPKRKEFEINFQERKHFIITK